MALTALPAALANLQQQGFLKREFEQALKIKKAFRRGARAIPVPVGVGQTWTESKLGRKNPAINALNPSNRVNQATNGITPSTGADEQWVFYLNEYGDATPLNLMDQLTTIKKLFIENAKINGEQGGQSIEWLIRNGFQNAYMQGDTYVLGSGTTTTAHINDCRGFQNVMVSGNLVPVSISNPLTVIETGTTPQTLQVTGCAVDGSNVSTNYNSNAAQNNGGYSGVITFNSASAPTTGDRLQSINGQYVVRSNGRVSDAALSGGDLIKWQDVANGVKFLRNNGAETYPDGTYHLVISEDGIAQLMADPRFQMAWMGAFGSKEIVYGEIFRFGGVTIIPSTEVVVQPPTGSVLQTIHTGYLMAYDSVVLANFAGLRESAELVRGSAGYIEEYEDFLMVVKGATDTLLENITQAWKWVGDVQCNPDFTTNTSNMPTSGLPGVPNGNPLFKRGVAIRYVG